MGGRGSRRAETTANGDWQTACWSGYQLRRAISHDEASPFPKPFQLSISWSQKDSVSEPVNNQHPRYSVDDLLKGNQIGAAAGQVRVDARSVGRELIRIALPKNKGRPSRLSRRQVKDEHIIYSIALVGQGLPRLPLTSVHLHPKTSHRGVER